MNATKVTLTVIAVILLESAAFAQIANKIESTVSGKATTMQPQQMFEKMVGQWKGSCKTWFEPGKLADESEISGKFTAIYGGKFVQHTYHGKIKGKNRTGEELIAYNAITQDFQVSWVDDFHMSEAILFSVGPAIENGFSVTGKYDTGPDQPQWGWRTEYKLLDDDRLLITAYNITPDGQEAKAVETDYHRVSEQ